MTKRVKKLARRKKRKEKQAREHVKCDKKWRKRREEFGKLSPRNKARMMLGLPLEDD